MELAFQAIDGRRGLEKGGLVSEDENRETDFRWNCRLRFMGWTREAPPET